MDRTTSINSKAPQSPVEARNDETRVIHHDPAFSPLLEALIASFEQAASGKGRERHSAHAATFLDQPIFTIAREHGLGFLTGQAAKKLGESHVLLDMPHDRVQGCDRAIAELKGAIVYTAAAMIMLEQKKAEYEAARVKHAPVAPSTDSKSPLDQPTDTLDVLVVPF